MRLGEIAELIGGRLIGPDTDITGIAGISDAQAGQITFLASPKLLKELGASKASAVIVKDEIPGLPIPQIVFANPYYAFALLLERFHVKPHKPSGISPLAFVAETARVGEDVSIYPFSFVSERALVGKRCVIYPGVFVGEGSEIGEGSILYPNVTVREGVKIGSGVIIHPGAVIGSDGFGYTFHEGVHHKIPQVGGVIIGDDVEIGAGVTIDRATTGDTIIGKGTKIDNLVQVGHNVRVGENSIIVAQVAIGGSAVIGNYVAIGGQVGVADHAKIADGSMIAAQSGIMGEIEKGVYAGTPVIAHTQWLKSVALFARLPELSKRIKALEDKIATLSKEAE